MNHFALEYAQEVNRILHGYLYSTWFYKHQIYEVPKLCTALLVNYDDQKQDDYKVFPDTGWESFLSRMSVVKSDWVYFDIKNMERLSQQPEKVICGWEGRTIYFIRGGNSAEFWIPYQARIDVTSLLIGSAKTQGELIFQEAQRVKKSIPAGREHYREYEDFVRVVINYLFVEHLGEAKPQVRTVPGNESTEIRDLICQNRAIKSIWKDLKEKYSCSEILIDAKNKNEITAEDLRQVYCYLKPAVGLWGFILCRYTPTKVIQAYNRTLFKNFVQNRGILILTDEDLHRMIDIRKHGRDPSDYIQDCMSNFLRSL